MTSRQTDLSQRALACEGDTNTSSARVRWIESLSDRQTQTLLEEDSQYFLHQAMSTPCLDALESAEGIYLTDVAGKRYMDFHGNNVHQLGYGHPEVLAAIQTQLAKLPFAPGASRTRQPSTAPAN